MRDTLQEEIRAAVEDLDETFEPQPLELKTIHTADLTEVYKEQNAAKLVAIADEYLPLTIAGVEDKAGYTKVYDALQDVKAIRVKTDKIRKATNEKAQEWIRTNNEEAKRLTNIIAPVEKHLQAERDRYEAEIEAIKAEKQRQADERNQSRVDALLAVGAEVPLAQVVLMDDGTFSSFLDLATKAFQEAERKRLEEEAAEKARQEAEAAEKARIAQEEAEAREAERLALAKEREAIEAERAANARAAAQLKAEQEQLAAQRSAAEQAARDEQIRKDAEARTKAEAERQEKLLAEAKAEAEARAKAIEAARPDADKLIHFANAFETQALPEMSTDAGRAVTKEIKGLIIKVAMYARTGAANLTK